MSKKSPRSITIRGARTHNLKNVHCEIPHGRLTVMTGPSGSGKSSLAFDTLYAEGQRRYVESMSAYARQFLERIEKPDVDLIHHVLPAIALEQKNRVKNARSTVGTATEIYDYLRVLFATVGQLRCDDCGGAVTETSPDGILQALDSVDEGTKLLILAPISLAEIGVTELIDRGFFRVFQAGQIQELQALAPELTKNQQLAMVVDRLILKKVKKSRQRLLESIQSALTLSQGQVTVQNLTADETHPFQAHYGCQDCHKMFEKPVANWFSFNNPLGACPSCEGFGRIIGLDWDKIVPNRQKSLKEGAIHPFIMPSAQELQDLLLSEGKQKKIRMTVPYEKLTDAEKTWIMDGNGEYPGVKGYFRWLESKRYKVHVRVMLSKYRSYDTCPDCLGSRLQPLSRQVFINDQNIWDLCQQSVDNLQIFFETLSLSPVAAQVSRRLLKEIQNRLAYLKKVGLDYLTLSRQSRTLSGGEAQRINLSSALGNALTDTLYVLDEPTVGLHARDTQRLLEVLKSLRDLGNTVVVVEHDADVIREADHLVDMGPGGGEEGGRIVYEGPLEGLLETPYSLTAKYLNAKPGEFADSPAETAQDRPQPPVQIIGARGNNLKDITVSFPLNQLVCVTGVSGSGKSTLIRQTLYAAYQREKGLSLELDIGPHQALKGLDQFKDVILVDQSPPGRSLRSNPATYMKIYDDIRHQFAHSRKAMALGLKATDFSFNTPGGRCEACEGMGTNTIDMQFMADVTVVCGDCRGRRFQSNVLSVDLDGQTIDDVLGMTIDEAAVFFKEVSKIQKRLKPLQDIGLGYLKLGQSTATLSGGEAQRLKLASYLTTDTRQTKSKKDDPYLFLFDEPTTGLHLSDIDRLVQVFRRLLAAGHSVIVVEHNLEFIAQADHLVDLGPDGGDAGGALVATGSVEDIMACKASQTGRFLKAMDCQKVKARKR